jgi:hypothetical protein
VAVDPCPSEILPPPKSVNPGAITVSVMVVVAEINPDVPVIVRVALPTAALLLAMIVIFPLELTGLGVNMAVTPLGKPLTERVTLPVKPFSGVMLTQLELVVPWPIERVLSVVMEKLGATRFT